MPEVAPVITACIKKLLSICQWKAAALYENSITQLAGRKKEKSRSFCKYSNKVCHREKNFSEPMDIFDKI